MKAFALYNTRHKQIVTNDKGQLMIWTDAEDARENRISGEVVTQVEISMAMKSPSVTRRNRGSK